MKPRRALLAAVVVFALAPASQASAVTIGSNSLGSPSESFFGCASYPCVLIQDTIAGTPVRVPQGNWILTSWRVRGAEGAVALQVIAPTGGTSTSLDGNIKASTPDAQGVGNGADAAQEVAAQIPVATGDMIGLRLADGASIGGISRGDGTVIFEAPATASFSTSSYGDVEQLFQATIEPDSDGDGFGDASQDGCPTSPSTHGACPQPPGPPDPLADLKAGGKPKIRLTSRKVGAPKGTVAIELLNPNGYDVTGLLKLKRKGKVVGSKRYSIPASGLTKAKVKLSAAARRALKRAGKLKLAAGATVKGPVGSAGTLKATLSVSKRAVRPPVRRGNAFEGRTKNIAAKFSFNLVGGQLQDVVGEIMVTCFYPSGNNRSGVEVYDPPGAFPLGQKTEQFADNKPSAILGSNTRKRYTMEATQSGDTVTGTIQVSYGFVTYNPQTGFAQASSCVGEETFTAHRL